MLYLKLAAVSVLVNPIGPITRKLLSVAQERVVQVGGGS